MSQQLIIEALMKQLKEKDTIIAEKDAVYNALLEKNKALNLKIDELSRELKGLYRVVNSGKSETFQHLSKQCDVKQGNLFDEETTEQLALDGGKLSQQQEAWIEEILKKHGSSKSKNKSKQAPKTSGPKRFPEHLEHKTTTLLPDCDVSNAILLGYDRKQTLHFTAGKLWVEETLIPRYLVKDEISGVTSFVQATAPKRALDRLSAGPSMLSTLIVDKFVYHLPIYRQIKKFEQYGYQIPAATICGWLDKAQQLLVPLYDVLRHEILKTNSLQADETPIEVMGITKGKLHQGYLWLYRDVVSRLVLFDFQLSRAAKHPVAFLKDYEGFLQVDGYKAYENDEIGGKQSITLTYCHIHARRKFIDSLEFDNKRSAYYIAEIAKVYRVESEIKEKGLTGKQKVAYREKYAGPILEALGKWLFKQKSKVLPGTSIAIAIDYALLRWEGLKTYLHYDILEPDTNLLEQEVRPNTLGRKNWLFAGSRYGGKRIAMMYSLLACCSEYNIDPNIYLEDVISRIDPDNTKINDIKELLPHRWKPLSNTIAVRKTKDRSMALETV